MQVDDAPHRTPQLWFDDGSIIIQAGNNQFCVHRSILAACSPVFKDMLAFPQPADAELVEGCQVVHLTDAPDEVTVFLKAIFLPDYFMPFPAKTEFEILRGCLRLSHKYGVEHLHLRALVHFSSAFRTALSQWDKASYPYDADSESTNPSSLPQSDIVSWLAPMDPLTMFSCIQLAREVDAPWILPTAFSRLSHRLTKATSMSLVDMTHGGATGLSTQDQKSFVHGHIQQVQFAAIDILGCFTDPVEIPNCSSAVRCLKGRLSAVNTVRQAASDYPSLPLFVWGEDDWEEFREIFCPTCLASLQATNRAKRQEFWDDLPKMYGLPPWEELEKMKVAAIGKFWFPSEV
ncbi:hypothetical protein FB45DRAFT_1065830 [Roridomyces roridus]|uniref:BTB domain-containing protein n=1 Tax=Roridomyces roridus TaxID=1738132 RepID=A0AAD7FA97_9AGAR|nr:hypothetical protein FB45DRAFT_1065830 [Roridomyces roridus]